MTPRFCRFATGAALALVAAVAPLTAPAFAQEEAPEVAPAAATPDPTSLLVFQAGVVAGTCEELGELVYPLADPTYGYALVPGGPASGTPPPGDARVVGAPTANPAATSASTVPATIDELTDAPHAINVYGLPDDAGSSICGGIGGVRVGDELAFGLQERFGSDYVGTAHLRQNEDETTTVTLYLASGLADDEAEGAAGEAEEAAAAMAGAAPTSGDSEPFEAVPAPLETTGLAVLDGAFIGDELVLRQGVPTLLHVANGDDRDYLLRIGDLLTPTSLPANATTAVQFTTPTAETYEARLLDAETDEVVATLPVEVVLPGAVAP